MRRADGLILSRSVGGAVQYHTIEDGQRRLQQQSQMYPFAALAQKGYMGKTVKRSEESRPSSLDSVGSVDAKNKRRKNNR